LLDVLERIEAGEIRVHARDTTEPSPMAHEIVSGRPYTYLDDAPIEERRTRAVTLRRGLPSSANDLGRLDPQAIVLVREQAWPAPRDAEEVHDTLMNLVAVHEEQARAWLEHLEVLAGSGRATTIASPRGRLWIAVESQPLAKLLYRDGAIERALPLPPGAAVEVEDRDEARRRLLRGHMEVLGPVTAADLATRTGLEEVDA